MDQTKTVGVVIPIYNVEKYLKECLDSVINQTYKNLQIVLVNDGSTDEHSLNIAKEYTLKDERFILFDKENGGLSSARNVGIEYFSQEYEFKNITTHIKENTLIEFQLSKHNPYNIHKVYKSFKAFKDEKDLKEFKNPKIDYIIFLDSDDYWELNCIEECVPRMDGVEVVWFDHYFYYDGVKMPEAIPGTIIEGYNFKKSKIINLNSFLKRTIAIHGNSFWFAWHGMIKFDYLIQIKLKFLNQILHEDHYFGKLLFFQANYIYVLIKKMIHYRIRKGSIMNYTNDNSYIPNYALKYYKILDNDYFLYKKYHRNSSLFLTALMVFKFIQQNQNLNNIHLFKDIFFHKLKIWRDEILDFDPKYLENILYLSFISFFKLSKNVKINLSLLANFFTEVILSKNNIIVNQTYQIKTKDQTIQIQQNQINNFQQDISNTHNTLKQIQNLLYFQTQHGTAKQRIQNQLSYKLGQAMIINSKNVLNYILLPFILISIVISHKQEQKAYQFKIKKDPSLKLPPLETYPDYNEAMKFKNHLSYKLGKEFIKASKTWYKGGIFIFPYRVFKLYKEMKKKS